jgi:hypothetical protein
MGLWNSVKNFMGVGKGSDPSKAAMPYLNAIPGQISPYYKPYIDAGNAEINPLQEQYASLMSNPQALMDRIMSSYQQSPGAKYNIDQGIDAANRASSAGGMLGTPASQSAAMKVAQGLSAQDQNNYLQHALGLYGMGMSGAQNMMGMGEHASESFADQLANIGATQANLAYSGAQQKNQARSSLAGGIAGFLGAFM